MTVDNIRQLIKTIGFNELQQFVFPKGVTYNKENNRVRILETHLLFELTKRTTVLCKNKKSGKLSQNEMDSALVVPTGLEPVTL